MCKRKSVAAEKKAPVSDSSTSSLSKLLAEYEQDMLHEPHTDTETADAAGVSVQVPSEGDHDQAEPQVCLPCLLLRRLLLLLLFVLPVRPLYHPVVCSCVVRACVAVCVPGKSGGGGGSIEAPKTGAGRFWKWAQLTGALISCYEFWRRRRRKCFSALKMVNFFFTK